MWHGCGCVYVCSNHACCSEHLARTQRNGRRRWNGEHEQRTILSSWRTNWLSDGRTSDAYARMCSDPNAHYCEISNHKDSSVVDGMIRDGLWDPYNDCHMGIAGEQCAAKYSISREAQVCTQPSKLTASRRSFIHSLACALTSTVRRVG